MCILWQQWDYLNHSGEDKRIHIFRKGVNTEENVIMQVKFQLSNFQEEVENFSYYATGICSRL